MQPRDQQPPHQDSAQLHSWEYQGQRPKSMVCVGPQERCCTSNCAANAWYNSMQQDTGTTVDKMDPECNTAGMTTARIAPYTARSQQ